MTFKINQFSAELHKRRFAKASNFEVEIHGNIGPTAGEQEPAPRSFTMRCEATQLPGLNITSMSQKVYGPERKLPYGHTYNEASMSFICSEDLREREFFELWQERIVGLNSEPEASALNTYDIGYYKDNVVDITIRQLNDIGASGYTCKLIEAYPISIGQQDLNWSSNEALRLNVTFAFHRYKRFVETKGPLGNRSGRSRSPFAAVGSIIHGVSAAKTVLTEVLPSFNF